MALSIFLMQKNAESLGSIFDEQPTQITGNIHSVTNPSEQVIGYVSAGTVEMVADADPMNLGIVTVVGSPSTTTLTRSLLPFDVSVTVHDSPWSRPVSTRSFSRPSASRTS